MLLRFSVQSTQCKGRTSQSERTKKLQEIMRGLKSVFDLIRFFFCECVFESFLDKCFQRKIFA